MKKMVSIFVLAMASSVVLAGGIENPKNVSKVAVMKKGDEHIQLFYKSEKQANVEVSIYNEKNELKFSETIRKSDGFTRPYDFSNLKNGEYTIVVDDGSQRFVEKITTEEEKSIMLSHVVKVKDSNDLFLMVSNSVPQEISIQVKDGDGRLLYRTDDAKSLQHSRLLSFKSIKDVTITIANSQGETKQFQF